MDLSSDFTDAQLSFSVQGEGVSVDPVTGTLNIPTGLLRDGLEVVVSASSSSGTGSSSFRVTIASVGAQPVAPVLITAPSLIGDGRIGSEIAADPGQWQASPDPEFTFQWRLGGEDVPGAVDSVYVASEAEDSTEVTCVVTAENVAGTGQMETAALRITLVPPQATGVLEGVSLEIGSGVATVPAAPAFTGADLSFSVVGGDARIDAATGLISLLTDVLRTQETVTVTATNSGGSAEAAFRLTVRADTPTSVAAPTLSGEGRVGLPLTLEPGLWSGNPVPELAFQWRRNGTDIPGAAGLVYVPSDADDMAELSCAVSAANLAGTAQAETASVTLRNAAPLAVGTLADITVTEGSSPVTVAAGTAFSGGALEFSVTGASAEIDSATGVVTIPADTPRAGETVTVTATNSGGSASTSLQVTVTAAPVVVPPTDADWPDTIPAAAWTWVEASTLDGRRDLTVSTDVPAWDPTTLRLLWSDGIEKGGTQSSNLKQILPADRGTAIRKNNTFPAGTRLYCSLWWYRASDDSYRPATADGERSIVVGGSTYGRLSTAAINSAISQPLTRYWDTSATTNAHAWGQSALALAVTAFTGDTSADARLEEQVAYTLNGNEPLCTGNIMTQMDCRLASTFAVIRSTPRIWNGYPQARRDKITSIMKGVLFSAGYIGSDSHPFSGQRSLRGLRASVRSSGANIAGGVPAALMCAVAFFGAPTCASLMQDYHHENWLAELSNRGLQNIRKSFNYRALGITTTSGPNGLSADAPTPTQIKASLTNWKYYQHPISDLAGIMLEGEALNQTLAKTISTGLNNGAGATANPSRGKMAQDAKLLPNVGRPQCMFFEFDSSDAEGQRSSGPYVAWTIRSWTDAFTALAAAGLWNRSDPALNAILLRFNYAMTDYNFKTSGSRYYLSWAHSGGTSTGSTNGSDFGDSRNWTQDGTGLQIDKWGLRYTRELWSIFWNWSQAK